MKHLINLTVNGQKMTVEVESQRTLLELLRDQLSFTGVKEGCGDGECGACTVLMDGQPVRSCLILAVEAQNTEILTIEGLAAGDGLHPLQQSFVKEGAVQCGFCTPGFILAAKALLDRHPHPTDQQIREAMGGHLCRCTGYETIFLAIKAAGSKRR
ncbi:(2Fe-2S)-binding protein [bacterium]|nr:(2Fe-2S)-binding protein [bacterium]MCK4596858.1 (2Fe-2S)-binding protein [bacterium]